MSCVQKGRLHHVAPPSYKRVILSSESLNSLSCRVHTAESDEDDSEDSRDGRPSTDGRDSASDEDDDDDDDDDEDDDDDDDDAEDDDDDDEKTDANSRAQSRQSAGASKRTGYFLELFVRDLQLCPIAFPM